MRDFFEHKIVLNCPTKAEIAAAHRTLPAVGNIEISCGLRDLQTTLQALESADFFGMHIVSKQALERGVVLRAGSPVDIGFDVAPPPWVVPGQWWALVRIGCAGRLLYTPAVAVTVR